MNRVSTLIEKFASHAIQKLGDCYFCRRTALEIVDDCEAMGLQILGIDGYFLTDQITRQPIEWIFDMSTCPSNYDAARKFIESGANLPLFYEFVLHDPDLPEGFRTID